MHAILMGNWTIAAGLHASWAGAVVELPASWPPPVWPSVSCTPAVWTPGAWPGDYGHLALACRRFRAASCPGYAAERALRGVALGRRAWMFCGSDRGGERAAVMYSLIVTAKLNDTDPRAWLADVLRRIGDHPASRLHELLPWNWNKPVQDTAQAA